MAARGCMVALIGALASCWLPAQGWGYRVDWAGKRIELGVTLSAREVFEENRSTQRERTQGRVRLTPRIDWNRNLRFAAAIGGVIGGPTMLATKGGVIHWRRVFQDLSPAVDFEEFYVDANWGSFDLRLGKQRISWGKLDRFSPVDVLNSLSYFDPFLLEEAERKVGTPAALLTYSLPVRDSVDDLRLTFAWAPLYLPYRFPVASCRTVGSSTSQCEAERWFPPAAVPPSVFSIPAGALPIPGGGISPDVAVPLSFRLINQAPRATFRDGSFAARLATTVHQVDTAAYFYHGYDIQPAFSFRAWATGDPDPNPANPLHVTNLRGKTFLLPVFKSIDLWGFDVAHSRGPFAFRGEVAFVSGRPYAREVRSLLSDSAEFAREVLRGLQDLARGAGVTPVALPDAFVTRDAVEWGAGMDYQHRGWLTVLQVNQTNLLKSRGSERLLIRDVETRVFLTLRKNFLAERLQVHGLGGYGIDSSYSFLRPRLIYKWSDWLATELGYLFIAGRKRSVVGQYRRNDEGWITLSVRF
ncbi:MAG: hypothetical protein N3C12_13380 [Candidatus Binatia bacterium]|nr:hypothetical protein [Candidatus Binatia bacterium]